CTCPIRLHKDETSHARQDSSNRSRENFPTSSGSRLGRTSVQPIDRTSGFKSANPEAPSTERSSDEILRRRISRVQKSKIVTDGNREGTRGFVVYRVRVSRGGRKRPVPKDILKFQRSKRSVVRNLLVANLVALGSSTPTAYWLNEDSTYKYYEIILVDPAHNAVRNDPRIIWICNPVHKHRELRGLTSEGKKNRGLRGKGHNNHKNRPSRQSTWRRNNSISLCRYR
ncbi:unnamed protein product, partial [Brassica oleracea var. botrytis]